MPELFGRHAGSESVLSAENIKGLLNLIDLNGSVNHEGKVREADSNNLNGILLSQSIPDDNEGVKETENEQRQESRDSLVLGLDLGIWVVITKIDLEFAKDVTEIRS
jgi:hypothetical protein